MNSSSFLPGNKNICLLSHFPFHDLQSKLNFVMCRKQVYLSFLCLYCINPNHHFMKEVILLIVANRKFCYDLYLGVPQNKALFDLKKKKERKKKKK